MTKHIFETHTNCEINYCNICDGGLAICTVCGLAEGALTTDCPGENVIEWESVYNGERDYRNGKWVNEASPHSPTGSVERQKKLINKKKLENL